LPGIHSNGILLEAADNEKCQALEAWMCKLNSIISGKESDVIAMTRKDGIVCYKII
jgi:hypothetical protein